LSREPGQPTLKAQLDAREAELKRGVRSDPLVQAVLERFPGAEIVAVRPREAELPAAEPEPDLLPDFPDDDDSEIER
jgi:DNA polymerase-3 subunit gamma/tau